MSEFLESMKTFKAAKMFGKDKTKSTSSNEIYSNSSKSNQHSGDSKAKKPPDNFIRKYTTQGSGSGSGLPSSQSLDGIGGFNIDHMTEKEIEEKFEDLLDDMNLTEEKKVPLRKKSFSLKKEMLQMNIKNDVFQQQRSRIVHPIDYITHLQGHQDLSFAKKFSAIESLRIALTNNPLSWLKEFGLAGLHCILNILGTCYGNPNGQSPKLQHECIKCLKAFMNNTSGLRQVIGHQDALTQIAKSIDADYPNIMIDAVKLMAAVSLVDHEKAVEAITSAYETQAESGGLEPFREVVRGIYLRDRFSCIIDGLKYEDNDGLRVSCMQLINALIAQADDLDYRIHLRNEFMRSGLSEYLETLPQPPEGHANGEADGDDGDASNKTPTELLGLQVEVFINVQHEDYLDLESKFRETSDFDLDNPYVCFELISNSIKRTSAEPSFRSILQHLLLVRDNVHVRSAYYQLIDDLVSQVVLYKKSTLDPDFRYRGKVEVDAELATTKVLEFLKSSEQRITIGLEKKLQEAVTEKQEAEAKIEQLEKRLEGSVARNAAGSSTSGPSATPPTTTTGFAPPPPPPPMPPGSNIPPPPPMPGMGGNIPPPPPMPGMGAGPPPPPPPPMFGGGPGGPPPPPPMGGMGFGPPRPMAPVIPSYLPAQVEYKLETPLKKINWKKITPTKIPEQSFWANIAIKSESLFEDASELFSSDTRSRGKKLAADVMAEKQAAKKVKVLKVLDPKAAQNLMILAGSIKMTGEELMRHILTVNEEHLSDAVLQQLIKYIPQPQQLSKLEEYRKDYDELNEAEQFALTIGSIKRLEPRLKSTGFKIKFSESVQDVRPHLVAATAACEEIRNKQSFATLIEVIFHMGNFFNTGSKNAQAYGFDFNILPKLSNTKAADNKTTLLHYLIKKVEENYPDCLKFPEDLHHLDAAARVSPEQIGKNLQQMRMSIKALETDLKAFKPHNSLDRFGVIMTTFIEQAKEQYEKLQAMFDKMERLYNSLAQYYVFEAKKYTMDEFFGDIKSFKDQFVDSYTEIKRLREEEEKKQRARVLKEAADRERQNRKKNPTNNTKNSFVDMDAEEEGVMDNLLVALKTGKAFQGQNRRRRATPNGLTNNADKRAVLNRTRSREAIDIPFAVSSANRSTPRSGRYGNDSHC